MLEILETKLNLYKEKSKLNKIKRANEFLDLDENIVEEYFFALEKYYDLNEIFTLSLISLITSLTEIGYTLYIDDKLQYDFSFILRNGVNPIIKDLKEPLYIYLAIVSLSSYILSKKISEIKSYANKNRKTLERREPKLLGYKYVSIVEKNKN